MINKYIEYLKVIKKYSDYTTINYRNDLEDLELFLNKNNKSLLEINEEIVSLYLSYLYSREFNRNSISRKLSSIRSFYNYLLNEDIIKINYFNEVSNPKKNNSLPHFIQNEDLEKMFKIPNKKTPLGQRNLLIIEMLYATGVRVSELVNIKVKDIDKYNHIIKILGKGSKERIVIYGSFCSDILELYLNDGRKQLLNNKDSEYLFINKFGNKLSDRYIREILKDIITKASLEVHVSPHMLRHTFATDMLSSGADLVSVKELLGHESLNTTSIYTHITDEQVRKVYENAHPRAKE